MPIHFLDPSVYQKIAAGEIIENPSSIIRELLDNSIDAKSTQIDISVEDSGLKCISILDNGLGMNKEDLLICYQKYSTSKINHFEDIYKISSLGFRGEALNSICSVAEVIIQSKDKDNSIGHSILIKYNQFIEEKQTPMKTGTFIKVKNIFENIPIRKMHLKMNKSEITKIKNAFVRKILPFTEIQFKLFNNKKLIYFFEKKKSKIDRIAILQEDLNIQKNLLLIEYQKDELQIEAYISKPNFFKNKKDIFFYINNRYTQNFLLHKAVLQAYENILPIGKFPIAYFFITIPQHLIDINIHPSKKEIRIFVELELCELIKNLIQDYLIKNPEVPKMNIKKLKKTVSKEEKLLHMEISKNQNSISSSEREQKDFFSSNEENHDHIGYHKTNHSISGFPLLIKNINEKKNPHYKILAQLFKTYILIEYENEFILIDQHAIHEILNYLKIKAKFLNEEIEFQYLIHPINIKIDPFDYKILSKENIQKSLEKLGFLYTFIQKNIVEIKSLPFFLSHQKVKETIDHIIQFIKKKNEAPTPIQFLDHYIKMQSCKNSIKSGDIIDEFYFNQIITELSTFEHHFSCPHGRPIAIEINQLNLEKLFLRS